jgi:DNA-binding NtrC family response regulator
MEMNTRRMTLPAVPGFSANTILAVSPFEQDKRLIQTMVRAPRTSVLTADGLSEAIPLFRSRKVSLVICERDLPDGDWRDMLGQMNDLVPSARLVVASRLADERLWAEVLNLGGYDVLAKPFSAEEVTHVIESALQLSMTPAYMEAGQ